MTHSDATISTLSTILLAEQALLDSIRELRAARVSILRRRGGERIGKEIRAAQKFARMGQKHTAGL